MKGWKQIPKFIPLTIFDCNESTSLNGKINQYFGMQNHVFPYPPGQDNDISLKNYDKIKNDVEIINYVNDVNYPSGEGGSHPRTWLIRFMKPGQYEMDIINYSPYNYDNDYINKVDSLTINISE